MPDLPEHPMQGAVVDLMVLFDGVHRALQVIDAAKPSPTAGRDEQVAFLDGLRPVIAEAQLSLALANGALATRLRRHLDAAN